MIGVPRIKALNSGSSHKRVLLVSFLEPWSIGPGQGAPSLYETLTGYAREGWEVDYVTFHKRHVLGVAHEQSVTVDIPGVREHRFRIPRYRWLPANVQAKLDRLILFPLLSLHTILRLLKHRRPSLFYAYEASGILTAFLVKIFHNRHLFTVSRVQGVSVLGNSYRKLTFMIRKLETLLSLKVRASAYIMTDDGTNGDEVWRHWNRHVNETNLLHIRNGISAQLLATPIDRHEALQRFGLNEGDIHILMLSRLDPIKRIDRGIRAIAAISRDFPHARLVVVGDGEQRPELESLAKELGVAHQVLFLGSVNRDGVAEIMQCSDIFLSLYDFSNCGNPLFEALLNGLPIITLDNGATGTVIAHGHNGLLLPVDDADALKDALENLLTDASARENLGRRASDWAKSNLKTWTARMNEEVEWVCRIIQP